MEFLLAVLVSITWWQWAFMVFCIHRFTRLIINIYAHYRYQSIAKPLNPTFTSEDVTVIVPTIENDVSSLKAPLLSILACNPAELILVTTTDKYAGLLDFALSMKDSRIKVYQSRIANKRLQLREAIPRVKSRLTILVDDDVTWPSTALPWILAPFENPKIGSVGVCQQVRRLTEGTFSEYCWNWEGADYIERRNFEISATHYMDGGTSCMSGRTNALRTEILQDPLFLDGFCNERWGRYHLNADDDNFVTRWLVSHGWSTYIQYNEECLIETTLENNSKFVLQCLRWARSNWRSNFTTLVVDRLVWSRQPYSTYAIYTATFTSLGLFTDPLYFYLYHMSSTSWTPEARSIGWAIAIIWYLFTKVVKRIGLIRRRPRDIFFIPVSILFGFFHGLIKLYALWTWNVTSWGSRPDGDTNDDERMTPQILPAEVMNNPTPDKGGLIRYRSDKAALATEKTELLVEIEEFESEKSE